MSLYLPIFFLNVKLQDILNRHIRLGNSHKFYKGQCHDPHSVLQPISSSHLGAPARFLSQTLFHSFLNPTKMRICWWNLRFRRQMKQSFILSQGGRSIAQRECSHTCMHRGPALPRISPSRGNSVSWPGEVPIGAQQGRKQAGNTAQDLLQSKEHRAVVAGWMQWSPGGI